MSQGQLGKWAEKQVRDWLENQSQGDFGFAYYRFPDARAARGALAAAPADFLVSQAKGSVDQTTFLEVKESAQANRLPKAKISQWGMLNKFQHAGINAYVVVYRSAHNDWVFFNSDDLFPPSGPPTSFPYPKQSFATAKDVLEWIYA